MNVKLEHIGRRFNREWIFKEVDHSFEQGGSYAILGPNGSGKSTLLQIISGSLTPSEGSITYSVNGTTVDVEDVFGHLSIAAPYIELVEEFTLSELIDFHFRFKPYRDALDKAAVIDILGFNRSRHKAVKYFSSGMKQRTKLALAFCSATPLLMLDEPASNLDSSGIDWYLSLVESYSTGRTLIIGSNQEYEYSFCANLLYISQYKNF